jgi:hypothetical protein
VEWKAVTLAECTSEHFNTRCRPNLVAFQTVNRYFFPTIMIRWRAILFVFLLMGCNGGLSPTPPPKPGISGTVYFAKGSWPGSPDSLSNLWIFASQVYPLDSSLVFNGLFSSSPTIFLYPSVIQNLPLYVDTVNYFFSVPLGIYKYIGVIQHVSSSFSVRSMRVVGFARNQSDTAQPLQVQISEGAVADDVNIFVDFRNPPPQPF